MIVLALDPSSTCSGYAVLERTDRTMRMIEAGTLKGKAAASAVDRVLAMRAELLALLCEHRPHVVLVEMPLERQYTRTAGKRSGMAVWAGAAWALWMAAVDWAEQVERERTDLPDGRPPCRIKPVNNTTWATGSTKELRKAHVRAAYPQYDPADDAGGDVADAVSLALWWDGWAERVAHRPARGGADMSKQETAYERR